MNTLEGNKLIAKFMGARDIVFSECQIGLTYWNEGDTLGRYGSFPDGSTNVTEDELYGKYYESWDWLIPVIAKIHSLGINFGDEGFEFIETINDKLSEFVIGPVHEAVVEFIKWYNENGQS